jgi:integrase
MSSEIKRRGKSNIYYANVRYMGIRLRDCLKTSDSNEAQRRLIELKLAIERGDYQAWTIDFVECVKKYRTSVLPTKSKGCQIRYDSALRTHLLPAFTGKQIVGIESDVKQYFEDRCELPESSLKKHARVLRDVIKQGNPSFELPAIVYRNKGFYQDRCLTEPEMLAIVSFLSEKHQSLALLMAYTGLRLGNAIAITWKEVDLKKQMIKLQQSKTGNWVKIPIAWKLLDFLKFKNRIRNLHDDSLFHTTDRSFQKAWKNAVKKSSIDWNVRPHDLRHFFCSYLLNKGVDHMLVAALSGHKSVNVLKNRYGHYSDERLKEAVDMFEDTGHNLDTNIRQSGGQLID